jgi:hypothetical protein
MHAEIRALLHFNLNMSTSTNFGEILQTQRTSLHFYREGLFMGSSHFQNKNQDNCRTYRRSAVLCDWDAMYFCEAGTEIVNGIWINLMLPHMLQKINYALAVA